MTADSPPPPPVWYMLHTIFTYLENIDIVLISQYFGNIVSILYQIPKTNIVASLTGSVSYCTGQALVWSLFPLLAENVPCPLTSKHLLEMLHLKCSVNGQYNITNYNNILYSISLQNLTAVHDNKKNKAYTVLRNSRK